ncbi:MAG: hypothetical protein ACE5FK_11135, partial [Candidatus Methylomirabilia bacterium]
VCYPSWPLRGLRLVIVAETIVSVCNTGAPKYTPAGLTTQLPPTARLYRISSRRSPGMTSGGKYQPLQEHLTE